MKEYEEDKKLRTAIQEKHEGIKKSRVHLSRMSESTVTDSRLVAMCGQLSPNSTVKGMDRVTNSILIIISEQLIPNLIIEYYHLDIP